jgi:diguanylate cyclase
MERLQALEFGAEDADSLRALHRTLTQEAFAPLASVFSEIDVPVSPSAELGAMAAVLKRYFQELTLCDFSLERTSSDLQLWLLAKRATNSIDWPLRLLTRYLTCVSIYLVGEGARGEATDKALLALQKLVLFQVGLISVALLSEEQSFYAQRTLYDPDTGLPNQFLMQRRLRDLLQARAEDTLLAALRLRIETGHRLLGYPGYPSVEEVMAAVAARLLGIVRPIDVLARVGKAEFVLLLPGLRSEGQVMLAANKLTRTLEPEFVLNDIDIVTRPIIGAALAPTHATDAEGLMRLAETACAAASGRAENYLIYEESLDSDQRLQRSLEAELRMALRENELNVYYQPQLDLRSGAVENAEALLRWKNRRGEFVPPNVIVTVAEQCGLMFELTRWILNTASRHAAEFRERGLRVTISVNLTASDLMSSELVEVVEQCLRTWGVPAHQLLLEITEGSMIHDINKVLAVLEQLKRVGVELSIDDFGTGYSSLAYLKRLPIDEIKIDQIFVRQMLSVKEDERIVRTIIDLAHNLDLRVVAEGVEDQDTLTRLKALECDVIQGYLLSRPLPQQEFAVWLLKRNNPAG